MFPSRIEYSACRRLLVALFMISLSLAVGLTQTGCKSEPVKDADQSNNMRVLAIGYGQFLTQNRGRPPKNEAALRKFLESRAELFEQNFGITSIDDLFVSPRDNEPYVVTYKKQAKIVAYEKTGLDGMRYVADDLGIVEEVDETKFAELVPNAK